MISLNTKEKARIFSKISITSNGCWEYRNAIRDGYGRIYFKGRRYQAHRFFYELQHGEIPKFNNQGKEIDHLCRNRLCVNTSHLELVDKRTNTIRGRSPSSLNREKKVCPKGHSYIQRFVKGRPVRVCKICLGNFEKDKHRIEYKKKYNKNYHAKRKESLGL